MSPQGRCTCTGGIAGHVVGQWHPSGPRGAERAGQLRHTGSIGPMASGALEKCHWFCTIRHRLPGRIGMLSLKRWGMLMASCSSLATLQFDSSCWGSGRRTSQRMWPSSRRSGTTRWRGQPAPNWPTKLRQVHPLSERVCRIRLTESYLVKRPISTVKCRIAQFRPLSGCRWATETLNGLLRWGTVDALQMEDDVKANFKKLKDTTNARTKVQLRSPQNLFMLLVLAFRGLPFRHL